MYLHQDESGTWLTESERENLQIKYRVKEVIFEQSSPFQHVMVLNSYDFGKILALDGIVQTTSMDGHIYNEMIVHVPLMLHPHPRKVLIIGGGDCGAAREACKHANIKQIDMVEIDQLVVDACMQHLPEVSGRLSDPRVQFIYDDGVEFVKHHKNTYDVIIVDSSDPVGPAQQLFELDFYRNLHSALKHDGMMVCQSQSPIFHKDVMKQSFEHIQSLFPFTKLYQAVVPTYPGGLWSFTLGSKQPLNSQINKKFPQNTQYFNKGIMQSCFQLPEFLQNILTNQYITRSS